MTCQGTTSKYSSSRMLIPWRTSSAHASWKPKKFVKLQPLAQTRAEFPSLIAAGRRLRKITQIGPDSDQCVGGRANHSVGLRIQGSSRIRAQFLVQDRPRVD